MNSRGKEFVVSVADFAFYFDNVLACTGTTNLSSTLSVSMQEQAVNAGRGNQKVYSFKYGRELTAELEAADWKLEYIAMQTGSKILMGLEDFYHLNDCITLSSGVGTLPDNPVGKVGVELPNGTFIEVEPGTGNTIDLSGYDLTNEKVYVTYRYKTDTKRITIDASTAPLVGRLVLHADRHNNKKGKVGTLEIVIPSYSLDGNFDISFTPDGVVSTTMSGTALAVEGDTCSDGSAVYAYIQEIDEVDLGGNSYSDIAISVPAKTLVVGSTMPVSVLGIISAMYKPVELDIDEDGVTLSLDATTKATLSGTTLTGVAAGTVVVTATYAMSNSKTLTDEVTITVTAA